VDLSEAWLPVVLQYGAQVTLALLTFLFGWWLINTLTAKVSGLLQRRKVDPTLHGFIGSLAGIILKVLLLVSVASMIGVETTSFIAVIGAAGLAIGLALQGSLTNFAGGVLILFFKPYKVGDYIKTNGEEGFVESIDIFYTFLRTMDSRHVILPNGPLANGNLVNYTMDEVRRVELSVGISYHNRFEDAETALFKMIGEESRVLSDPPPFIGVTGYGDSSIDLTIRAWVKNADYWPVFFDLNKRIKPALDNANISIPFPQRDVHLFQKAT
ncbi:MAG TPA: mechanosensitive ion channel protein MscS, partial [Gammaproteobacteria bacterium]|nr:mechanosensitive ion channel protein MscS [Gammaproteobacteria bacterium]